MYDVSFFLKSLSSPSAFDIYFFLLNYVSFNYSSITCTRSSHHSLVYNYTCTTPRHFYFSYLPHVWNALLPLDLLSLTHSKAIDSFYHHFSNIFLTKFHTSDLCTYHFHRRRKGKGRGCLSTPKNLGRGAQHPQYCTCHNFT